MAGMAIPGTRRTGGFGGSQQTPTRNPPEGGFWVYDNSYASDASGNPIQNSGQPRTGSYRNAQGQIWDDQYGWTGAPMGSAIGGLSGARPMSSGSVTIGGGTYATPMNNSSQGAAGVAPPSYMQPGDASNFNIDQARSLQEQLDSARVSAERSYQQGAVPMQIENMRAILNMLNETSASGGSAGRVTHGGAAESAARDAAYARAKDQIGLQTRGAIESLRDAYGGTGMIGDEHAALAGAAGRGFNQMGEVTREQLIRDLNRAAEVSDLTYQGDITQRGQDLSRLSALMNLSQAGVRSLY